MKVYEALAKALQAQKFCKESGNDEWWQRHEECLYKIMKTAPRGGGFGGGPLRMSENSEEFLLFGYDYHHTDGEGEYTHWTHHMVGVKGSLCGGFRMFITNGPEVEFKHEFPAEMGVALDFYAHSAHQVDDQTFARFYDIFNIWLQEEWEDLKDVGHMMQLALIALPRKGVVSGTAVDAMMIKLREQGQLEPIRVSFIPETGFYRIVSGRVRAEAMVKMRWEDVWVEEVD